MDGAAVGQRGLRDFAGETVIHLLRGDVHLVVVFSLRIPDLQGQDPHVIVLAHRLGYVTARVYQNTNLLPIHKISSQLDRARTQEACAAAGISNMTYQII